MSALRGIDRALAWITWLIAAALVAMLFVGPVLVADDDPEAAAKEDSPSYDAGGDGDGGESGAAGGTEDGSGAAGGSTEEGMQLFVASCGSCHTLSDAGTSGSVGPSLDGAGLSAEEVASVVAGGRGSMPSFSDSLDEVQIDAIAAYVSSAPGS